MANIIPVSKAASVNPLKSSQPLGAAYAFLGIDTAMPLFHGSQGCTSLALVLLGRHFKESIPLQTTAMDEISTILGGADNLEEAILNLKKRTNPRLIGICTTALVETRGEDFAGELAAIKRRRAAELADTEIVLVNTPDFDGAIEEGWSKTVTAMIDTLVRQEEAKRIIPGRINILAGSHLTVADIELLRETAENFGLEPIILPDISGSLDGTIPDRWIPTTYGGTPIEAIREMGRSAYTVAIGEHMRKPARLLAERYDVPFMVFETLSGLKPVDRLITLFAELSGRPVPAKIRRRRNQLTDAMLDGHFYFGGKRIAIAAEPDLLYAMATFFTGLGAEIPVAVTTTGHSAILEKVPAPEIKVGDLGDFEDLASVTACDLLVSHSHGRQASDRLGVPLMRAGFPIFDRIGSQYRRTILYEGTRDFIFEVANIFQSQIHTATPDSLNPFMKRATENSHDRKALKTH
jgi:nitrogenase molybdenum-iron protein NifN